MDRSSTPSVCNNLQSITDVSNLLSCGELRSVPFSLGTQLLSAAARSRQRRQSISFDQSLWKLATDGSGVLQACLAAREANNCSNWWRDNLDRRGVSQPPADIRLSPQIIGDHALYEVYVGGPVSFLCARCVSLWRSLNRDFSCLARRRHHQHACYLLLIARGPTH